MPVSNATTRDGRPEQLPLLLRWRSGGRFATFEPGPNAEAARALEAVAAGAGRRVVFVWGSPGSGKSHLLEACCARAAEHDRRVGVVPLAGAASLAPAILDGLGALDLVCIDDVDRVAGAAQWEEALFHLFNALDAGARTLVLTAAAAPSACGFSLPDLASRFAAALVLRLRPLDDATRLAALRRHALTRGLRIDDDVGRYVLQRHSRDLPALVGLLDRLDREALAARRQLTVPFVREVMARGEPGEG
ncbi:MAG: DnaA regulatory inactivator Hda [Chromatiales bacterium]|nr:DnaA regulatory inactivator Hda [Chromatiales bacterium]